MTGAQYCGRDSCGQGDQIRVACGDQSVETKMGGQESHGKAGFSHCAAEQASESERGGLTIFCVNFFIVWVCQFNYYTICIEI